MSNHCVDVECRVCGREFDARLHLGVCPRCGTEWKAGATETVTTK